MAHFRKRSFFRGLQELELVLDGEVLIKKDHTDERTWLPEAKVRRRVLLETIDEHESWERLDPLPPATFCDLPIPSKRAPEALAVFADQLIDRGDPWGPLLQLSLMRGNDDARLTVLEVELERLCTERFLSRARSVLKALNASVEWADGFPRGVTLGDWHKRDRRLTAAIDELARSPLAKAATHWSLGVATEMHSTDEHLEVLLRIAPPVTHLRLGAGDYQLSWITVPHQLSRLAAFPQLTSLGLRGGSGELEALQLAGLTEFSFETGNLSRASLAVIAAAPWPQLVRLDVSFGSYGCETNAQDVETFLARLEAPKLEHLGLRACEFPQELIPVLAEWPGLRRLRSLDLSSGGLLPDDVRALEPYWPAFAHLERLDLSDNQIGHDERNEVQLDTAAAELLARLCPKIRLGKQRSKDEIEVDGRFASIGE